MCQHVPRSKSSIVWPLKKVGIPPFFICHVEQRSCAPAVAKIVGHQGLLATQRKPTDGTLRTCPPLSLLALDSHNLRLTISCSAHSFLIFCKILLRSFLKWCSITKFPPFDLPTMTVPPSPSGSVGYNGMSFVPRDLVTIQVGCYSANVYPKIDLSMPIFKRAHTFQVACSTIELLPVETRVLLDALGTQLNCSAIVDGLMSDWRSCFDNNWGDFANLAIRSFHNSAGARINNTTTAANPNILLPVQNSAVANCRKVDVCFVRVPCLLDFASLFTIANPGPTMLRVSFYVELPQTTVVMATAGGTAYNLTTWHGPANLPAMTREQLRTLILEPCLQGGPIALMPNDFNLSEANIDSTKIRDDIHGKLLKLGYKQICHAIFGQLCLGYSDQPHTALEHIHQSAPGPNYQLVTLLVVEF